MIGLERFKHIAWERGLLDPRGKYTRAMLVELLEQCTDFENAESNLQMIARVLNVTAERTPKFHCELAGEGIEYNWAFCKKKYRCRPICEKKGRERFQELVRKLTSWEVVDRIKQVKRCSARARAYMSTYYNIHYDRATLLRESDDHEELPTVGLPPPISNGDGEQATDVPWKPAVGEIVSMYHIEQIRKKIYHSHRGVNSFEKGSV